MRRSLLAGLAAAALLAAPSLAVAQETNGGEVFGSLGHVTVPGTPLTSFDISWVDKDLNLFLLADRSNVSVDVFAIQVNPSVNKIFGSFAGNVAAASCGGLANVCSGPNGIITLNNPNLAAGKELWVGDGPTNDPVCGGGGLICSTVKVFNTAALRTHTISTNGSFRADELCFAPPDGPDRPTGLVLIANDADSPPFVSLIATDGAFAYKVVQRISFPTATNGIEQCQWDPGTARFYLNIPEISGPGDDTAPGAVFRINPNVGAIPPDGQLAAGVTGPFLIDIASCAGPQGMAIGPRPGDDILLGCNAASPQPMPSSPQFNSVIIDNGALGGAGSTCSPPVCIVATLFGQGGADQVWFEDIAGQHYFITGGSLLPSQNFGITDAVEIQQDMNFLIGFTGNTTRRAHSTAGWSGSPIGLGTSVTVAWVPIPAIGGAPPGGTGFSSMICGSDAMQGCIAAFGAVPQPTEGPGD
jgi:hypothetical protein